MSALKRSITTTGSGAAPEYAPRNETLNLSRPGVFTKAWYIAGAILGGYPLAQGSLYLSWPRPLANRLTAASLTLVVVATLLVILSPVNLELLDPVRPSGAVLAWGQPYPSPLWEGRDGDRAYVCRNYAGQLPADTPELLLEQLSGSGA